MSIALPTPVLPQQPGDKITWNLPSNLSFFALQTALAAKNHPGLTVLICVEPQAVWRLAEACQFFEPNLNVFTFPDWETLPYDPFSPHPDIIAERLETLYQLTHRKRGLLIVPASTISQRLSPPSFLHAHTFILKKGSIVVMEDLRRHMEEAGYRNVTQVLEPGEYATRGSVFDIYPMGSTQPLRMDLFDNEIDSIKVFNPETQRSESTLDEVNILPAREFPLTDQSISQFRERWRAQFGAHATEAQMYKDITTHSLPPGIEYFLPLFFKETATLFDYFPANTFCVFQEGITPALDQFSQEVQQRYNELSHDIKRPILPPASLFLSTEEVYRHAKPFGQIRVHYSLPDMPLPDLSINHKLTKPLASLETFLKEQSRAKVLFCCESLGRREALLGMLKTINCQPKFYTDLTDFLKDEESLAIAIGHLDSSLWLPSEHLIIITEDSLYKDRVWQSRARRRNKVSDFGDSSVRNLAELKVGDLVVHIEHGVGRYQGLQIITLDNEPKEFIALIYANHDKLYVPVTSLHLISRYSAANTEHIPLQRLGNSNWEKIKRQAAEQLRDVAADLLALYAKRAAKVGFSCKLPDENYQRFSEEFPFEETPDQESAIKAIIQDMTSSRPMDRLICGDVGFGKTEVAMRAAFLAVQNHKQVVVLVPTTLLAQQHFNTFSDRFAEWPVKIELLSRFRTGKEQQNALDQLEKGKVDIIIGTHKLLSENVHFHDLGLVIIDEEHRFGVNQKDRMKKLRAEVDILALTATPIPRTLNMALSAIRDLSIIATPPQRRLSIKTFVHERNHALIKEAILREILRGGQVYYLHNDVSTIEKTAMEIAKLVPEAKVDIAHGQMREKQLEHIMAQFYHQKFNILVCTTIIETGIDIPSANTIIIDRADRFGLAQLHQLRGRVGRSHHQAYAYLFAAPQLSLTTDAIRRLEAISTYEDLGAGFALASQDLEIRGAGELLGEEQSGNIQALGFSLYMELLDETVEAIKKGSLADVDILEAHIKKMAEIELHIPVLIPENYLPDIQLRLVFYKRIASAKTPAELSDLQVEMIDRFGLLPSSLKNLFETTELRLKAEGLGIKKLEIHKKGGKITFAEKPNIDPIKMLNLIQKQSKMYKLNGPNVVQFTEELVEPEKRLQKAQDLLEYFS